MLTTFKAVLTSKDRLTEDVYVFRFTPTEGSIPSFVPGQYMIMHVPVAGSPAARRLYSIASGASDLSSMDLLIQLLPHGLASEYIMKLTDTEEVTFQGPAGMFVLKREDRDVTFLATGTGYAPIHSILLDLAEKQFERKVRLYWGFPTMKSAYFLEELEQFAQNHPFFSYKVCLSRETDLSMIPQERRHRFELGRVTKVWAAEHTHDFLNDDYYVCGGREVVDSLKQFLLDAGIPKQQVHFEKF